MKNVSLVSRKWNLFFLRRNNKYAHEEERVKDEVNREVLSLSLRDTEGVIKRQNITIIFDSYYDGLFSN